MTLKEAFQGQLKNYNDPNKRILLIEKELAEEDKKKGLTLTAEIFSNLSSKIYSSGRKKQIGDICLFAFLHLPVKDEKNILSGQQHQTFEMKLVNLCKEEIEEYEKRYAFVGFSSNKIPTLTTKGDESIIRRNPWPPNC